MGRGVAIDLLQMAKRIGPQYEATEYEDLSGEENLTLELSMKAPMSVSKPADLG